MVIELKLLLDNLLFLTDFIRIIVIWFFGLSATE